MYLAALVMLASVGLQTVYLALFKTVICSSFPSVATSPFSFGLGIPNVNIQSVCNMVVIGDINVT